MRHTKAERKKQQALFDDTPEWQKHMGSLPEYNQHDLEPWKTVHVHFRDKADMQAFAELVGQKVTMQTRALWYPKVEPANLKAMKYITRGKVNSKYPIYVPSKGRWESRLTIRALEKTGVDYQVVIEAQEYDNYAAVVDPARLLVLPFANQGLVAARNWIMQHSIKEGHAWHWQLDDNIRDFYRLHNNLKVRMHSGACFRAIEDFVDRYSNIAVAGMNYELLVPRKTAAPAIQINARVYSCSLVNNSTHYGWRGTYNDDTDLCLRALKDGWCTALFNQFLADKQQTMTVKGGNTDIYQGDGRLEMAQSLVDQHPDVAVVSHKWGRPQHHVDYRPFKNNRLKLRPGVVVPDEPDDCGMELINLEGDE